MPPIEALRTDLFKVAYKMLGQLQDAEDVVQEVMIDLLKRQQQTDIKNLKAYAIRATVNQSLNALKRQKREDYFGVWLPEPYLTGLPHVETKFDVSYAFLHLLSQLNPKERAVFILRESFDFPFQEIAENLELDIAHCRKLYERGKGKLKRPATVTQDHLVQNQQLLYKFLSAAASGNLLDLVDQLADDIVIYSDGGGKATAAVKPIHGAANCSKFLFGIYQQTVAFTKMEIITSEQNVFISFIDTTTNKCYSVLSLDIVEEKVETIYIIRNPDKIL